MDGSFRPKNFQPRFYRFFDVVRVVFAVVVVVVVVLLLPLLPQLWIRIRRHRGVGGTDERIIARRNFTSYRIVSYRIVIQQVHRTDDVISAGQKYSSRRAAPRRVLRRNRSKFCTPLVRSRRSLETSL